MAVTGNAVKKNTSKNVVQFDKAFPPRKWADNMGVPERYTLRNYFHNDTLLYYAWPLYKFPI